MEHSSAGISLLAFLCILADLCANECSGDQVFDTELKECHRNLFFIQQLEGEGEDFTLRRLMWDRVSWQQGLWGSDGGCTLPLYRVIGFL